MPSKPPVHRPPGTKSSAEVKLELERQRPSAARRGYGPRWRRARQAFLEQHPWCALCSYRGRHARATVVDHVQPHRGAPRLFWSRRNWQALCKRCHDSKTVRDGRWGSPNAGADRLDCACGRDARSVRPEPVLS